MQTMLAELDSPNLGNSQEDQRALQIALELSNLGLLGTCDDDSSTSSYDEVTKGKKSQNMTECVPVPSSEHVAEIVGRQGCKIKALRAKTNTYIKTPVRGEEPVFVVTGRKEDVAMARREVQSAAEHFTQIRASRNRHTLLNTPQAGTSPTNSSETDASASTITLQVRVPYRVVGLVVGPKGATIKRIQQQTHTYIVTPSRDKEPVFEVTGLPENVEKAKEEIEAHIATRTGTLQISVDDDFKNNGTEVGSPSVAAAFRMASTQSTVCNTNYKATNSTASAFSPYDNSNSSILRSQAPSFFPSALPNSQDYINMVQQRQQHLSRFPSVDGVLPIPGYFNQNNQNQISNLQWSTGLNNNDMMPSIESVPATYQFSNQGRSHSSSSSSSGLSPTSFSSGGVPMQRSSPTFSDSGFPMLNSSMNGLLSPTNNFHHSQVRRVGSDSVDSTSSSNPGLELCNLSSMQTATTPALHIESGYSSGGTTDSLPSGSPIESLGLLRFPELPKLPQRCVMCNEGTVAAALVPCGHNLFCLACANSVVSKSAPQCPCCNKPASMALFIQK